MAYRWAIGTVVGLFDALFRPSRFVAGTTTVNGGGRLVVFRKILSLTAVFLINLVLYAGPLTLAGFGVKSTATSPEWFRRSAVAGVGDTVTVWQLANAFVQNCAFLVVASVLTLVTFHLGILLSRNSKGILRSVHTVVYSTSAYLAGIFTVVWYLSTNENVEMTRRLVIAAQKAFIYYFIDLLGADLELPSGRPKTIVVSELSQQGTLLLAILGVLAIYYLFSLYLGTRINHHSSRFTGLIAVWFVALSPVLYVIGLVVAYAGIPVQL
jgi:hypothetical protein